MAEYAIEAHQTSERRACRLANLSRNAYRYVKKKANDFEIQTELARIAEDRVLCIFAQKYTLRGMQNYLRS